MILAKVRAPLMISASCCYFIASSANKRSIKAMTHCVGPCSVPTPRDNQAWHLAGPNPDRQPSSYTCVLASSTWQHYHLVPFRSTHVIPPQKYQNRVVKKSCENADTKARNGSHTPGNIPHPIQRLLCIIFYNDEPSLPTHDESSITHTKHQLGCDGGKCAARVASKLPPGAMGNSKRTATRDE